MNMVEKLAIAPVPKLANPCEFGTDDAHAGLVRGLHHPPLFRLARNRIHFAEARSHDDGDLDAMRGAIFHHTDGVVAGDRDDYHFGRFR